MTQLEAARRGIVTDEMRRAADAEDLEVAFVMGEVAAGRAVIPANASHDALEPIVIGRGFSCKVNANIGTSPDASDEGCEGAKLNAAISAGADTVMDLSVGGDISGVRRSLLSGCRIPFGTVPLYQAIAEIGGQTERFSRELILSVIEAQAEEGVDFMTIHAGLLRDLLPVAERRLAGIVSRGGAFLAEWMRSTGEENPLFTAFDEICAIFRKHDVTFSLGDGLRPGCLADACDEAQYGELDILGGLVERAREAGCQVMVEGPGHVPFDMIPGTVERAIRETDDAPFYVLGPIVMDSAPGYDHITSAIGATAAAFAGASLICYVTPREHLGLPDAGDVREGVMASRIAAHAADVALGRRGARERDDELSRARYEFRWEDQFDLALDPERARRYFEESTGGARGTSGEYCSMCGEDFCAVKRSRKALQG